MALPATGVRIVVDAMGGDYAPEVNIRGSLLALQKSPSLRVILVGNKSLLTERLKKRRYKKLLKLGASRLSVVDAEEVIGMDEPASAAIRKKTKSSIHVGLLHVKEEKAEAFVSAGNSGAVMAASMVVLGRLPDVERPAIIVKLPSASGSVMMLDAGANVDCKPVQLKQFAEMGLAYAEVIEEIKSPRIGLLSNGSESHKGNELTREAHALLDGKLPGYIGYVEGYDVFRGKVDVVVCDGFVGNVLLKMAEGISEMIAVWVRKVVRRSVSGLVGMVLMKKLLRKFKTKFHYQSYGAAPLLGTEGVVMIGHGSSSELAIQNGILTAQKAVEQEFMKRIREVLKLKQPQKVTES